MAALSQNIGAEGRGEGTVFERCNLRKPPSSGQLATFSPAAEEGLRFTQNKARR